MMESVTDGKNLVTIEGTVESVIYENSDNGYTVFDMSVDSENDIITACGILPNTVVGDKLKVVGEWTLHKNYGRQFSVAYYEKSLPATENEILRYLSSKAIKGIGPKTAQKLVDMYGEDTLDVIENHPEWLAKIPGITAAKAADISECFKEQFGVRTLMMFCREYLTLAMSMKIYKKWGGAALDIIKTNPYRLCDEINGISFERADILARSMGVAENSEYRLSSGIRWLLNDISRTGGHAFLPYNKLVPYAAERLSATVDQIANQINDMVTSGMLTRCEIEGIDAIYDTALYRCENEISEKLRLLDRICPRIDIGDVERLIAKIEITEDKRYADLQRLAIQSAVNNGVMILTGGPGTGKTTVIRAVISIFRDLDMDLGLAAPTGRAAKRMSEATGYDAKTVHRLLEMEFGDEGYAKFNRNENNLLDEDVIIIDEASMLDMQLVNSLLKAIKPGARLMLIGDSDQLPSVGAGNVLSDIIASEMFVTVKLTEIFRQAEESLIITNAHKINDGEMPTLNVKDNDFFFLPRNGDLDIARTVVDLWQNRLPKSYGEEIADNIQVISPSRKGTAGTESLNKLLQEALNPPSSRKREKTFRDRIFREGDRVMQTKNDYDLSWEKDGDEGIGVFNGDIGIIETINTAAEQMVINFDDRLVTYDYTRLDELDHAWAITVHKSQGSEYPVVIMPAAPTCPPMLLSRNLLYTAVTRAKKMVILVGQGDVIGQMVENNRQIMRYTGLFKGHENS